MKRFLALIATVLALSGCGYNDFQSLDEKSKAAWSEVLNQYQRRADLVPNIVASVKGEAAFEQDTLTQVIEARAKATSIQATPELVNNRITVARNQYIGTVAAYNVLARSFPTNLTAKVFNYPPKATFTVQNEAQISVPPTVDFSKPAPAKP